MRGISSQSPQHQKAKPELSEDRLLKAAGTVMGTLHPTVSNVMDALKLTFGGQGTTDDFSAKLKETKKQLGKYSKGPSKLIEEVRSRVVALLPEHLRNAYESKVSSLAWAKLSPLVAW